MEKKTLLIFYIISAAIIICACGETSKTKPYTIEYGAYGFEKATVTNIITGETEEKSFDGIINDKVEFLEWGWMFSFTVGVYENTEFVFKNDNRCFALKEGLAYELIGYNTLSLHFPRWQGYDYDVYEVIIIFGKQDLY